jgi:hypothetical protein
VPIAAAELAIERVLHLTHGSGELRFSGTLAHLRRTEVGDVDRVLDGDLQPFIRAYLLARRGEKQ